MLDRQIHVILGRAHKQGGFTVQLQNNLATLINTSMMTTVNIFKSDIQKTDILISIEHIDKVRSYCVFQRPGQGEPPCLDVDTHVISPVDQFESILV